MIKRSKKLLLRISKIGNLEGEVEQATRRFFGTFVSDIKRNWASIDSYKIKKKTNHDVSQLTSAI